MLSPFCSIAIEIEATHVDPFPCECWASGGHGPTNQVAHNPSRDLISRSGLCDYHERTLLLRPDLLVDNEYLDLSDEYVIEALQELEMIS